jgi:Mrp family chromosome partitioning ATPase
VLLKPKDFDYSFKERAVVPADIIGEGDQRHVDTLSLFLHHTARGWRIEGISKSHKMAALFLAGEIPAILSFVDLPECPDGIDWAETRLAEISPATIYAEEELQDYWNAPCYGSIPTQVPGDIVSSELTDAIHQIGLRIERALPDKVKLIGVTSTSAGVGCSMVAGAVATSFRAQGEKVLLVDLHPTEPKLHKRFRVETTTPGLSEMASGKAAFTDCLQPTQHEGIILLSAGEGAMQEPPNLDCLLELMPLFDRVIINAPRHPSIARFIKESDGLLALVIGLGVTRIQEVKSAIVELDGPKPPRFGYILNLVPASNLDEANERLREAKRTKGNIEILGARYFEAVDRVAVGFRTQLADEKYGRDQWRVLTRQWETGAFVERYVSTVPMMDVLLKGLDVDFADGKLTINELSTGLPFVRLSEPEITEEVEEVEVIDLDKVREQAKKKRPSAPSDFENNLKGLLEGYVSENLGSMDSSEFIHRVKVDPLFVQNHAPAFLGALFTEMTRSLIPSEINILGSTGPKSAENASSDEPEGGAPSSEGSVKIKVDFHDIFTSLFTAGDARGSEDEE